MILFANARNDARNYFFDRHCVDGFVQILEADPAAAPERREQQQNHSGRR
jgi:hypothetical protein